MGQPACRSPLHSTCCIGLMPLGQSPSVHLAMKEVYWWILIVHPLARVSGLIPTHRWGLFGVQWASVLIFIMHVHLASVLYAHRQICSLYGPAGSCYHSPSQYITALLRGWHHPSSNHQTKDLPYTPELLVLEAGTQSLLVYSQCGSVVLKGTLSNFTHPIALAYAQIHYILALVLYQIHFCSAAYSCISDMPALFS